jgi:hypothetical protein
MKLRIALLVVVAAIGCSKPKPSVTVTIQSSEFEQELDNSICKDAKGTVIDCRSPCPLEEACSINPRSHEAQVYAELWKVCKQRRLIYRVRSSYTDDKHYLGFAENQRDDAWITDPEKGPTEAAEALLRILNNLPTFVKPPERTPLFDTGDVQPQ